MDSSSGVASVLERKNQIAGLQDEVESLRKGVAERQRRREELVAELGAVLLGERLEIGSDVSNHAAYLAEWIQLLRQSPKLLYKVLSEARQAADLISPFQLPSEASQEGRLVGRTEAV
jgi:antirestriction protein ArdC